MAFSRSGQLYLGRNTRNRAVTASKRLGGADPAAYVHPSSRVATNLVAGPYDSIGRNCDIAPRLTIRRYKMLASDVGVVGDDHNWSKPGVPMQFAGRPAQRGTTIGAGAWLGHGVIVMTEVTSGDTAIIAARAVVTKDAPAFEVRAGTPAKKIHERFANALARGSHGAILEGTFTRPAFAERRGGYGDAVDGGSA